MVNLCLKFILLLNNKYLTIKFFEYLLNKNSLIFLDYKIGIKPFNKTLKFCFLPSNFFDFVKYMEDHLQKKNLLFLNLNIKPLITNKKCVLIREKNFNPKMNSYFLFDNINHETLEQIKRKIHEWKMTNIISFKEGNEIINIIKNHFNKDVLTAIMTLKNKLKSDVQILSNKIIINKQIKPNKYINKQRELSSIPDKIKITPITKVEIFISEGILSSVHIDKPHPNASLEGVFCIGNLRGRNFNIYNLNLLMDLLSTYNLSNCYFIPSEFNNIK